MFCQFKNSPMSPVEFKKRIFCPVKFKCHVPQMRLRFWEIKKRYPVTNFLPFIECDNPTNKTTSNKPLSFPTSSLSLFLYSSPHPPHFLPVPNPSSLYLFSVPPWRRVLIRTLLSCQGEDRFLWSVWWSDVEFSTTGGEIFTSIYTVNVDIFALLNFRAFSPRCHFCSD